MVGSYDCQTWLAPLIDYRIAFATGIGVVKNTGSEGESRQTILDWNATKIQLCKRHLSALRTNF